MDWLGGLGHDHTWFNTMESQKLSGGLHNTLKSELFIVFCFVFLKNSRDDHKFVVLLTLIKLCLQHRIGFTYCKV